MSDCLQILLRCAHLPVIWKSKEHQCMQVSDIPSYLAIPSSYIMSNVAFMLVFYVFDVRFSSNVAEYEK